MNLKSVLGRTQNILLVLTATAAGIWLPRIDLMSTLTIPVVIVLIYISLRGIRQETLLNVTHLTVIITALAISLVALPIGAFVLGSAIRDSDLRIGLYIIASVPTTAGSSIVWTKLSKGNTGLAAVIAIASIVLSPLVTPFVLSALIESTVILPPEEIITELLLIISGGVLLRIIIPDEALSESQVTGGARIAIALLVYSSASQLKFDEAMGSILTIVGSTVLLLLFGIFVSLGVHYIFRFTRDHRSAMIFSATLKNLGISILIIELLAVPPAVLIVISYYVVQQLFGALAAEFVFTTD